VIGGIESLCGSRLPPVLLKYCGEFPDVQVTLRAGKTTDLHGGLKAGLLDVYFTFGESCEEPGLRSERVATEPIIFVGPPNHRLSGQRRVTLEKLAQEEFLLTIIGCPVREVFEKAFAQQARRPRIIAEFASIAAMRAIVENGVGCTLLPAWGARVRQGCCIGLAGIAGNAHINALAAAAFAATGPSPLPPSGSEQLSLSLLSSDRDYMTAADACAYPQHDSSR
jgi:DNA-binding transcriptional LysR family regulator